MTGDGTTTEKAAAGRTPLGELAPKFAELNDDVLFGEVWSRDKQLSRRKTTREVRENALGSSPHMRETTVTAIDGCRPVHRRSADPPAYGLAVLQDGCDSGVG